MPNDNHEANWGRFLGIGLEVGLGVGLGFFAGRWIDRRYGWEPWGQLAGSMLGLSAGLYLLIKEALRINKK